MFDLHAELKSMRKAMRVQDVANILDVSRAMIYRLVDDGLIPAIRIGGAIRFDPAAVAKWAADQSTR